MSLVSNITDLVTAISGQIKTMVPRLLPSGGNTGMTLFKSGASDYSVTWRGPFQQAILTIPAGGTGRVTWTYPIPYAAGVIPVIEALAIRPTSSNLVYNVQTYGDPTNTSVVFEVNTINPTQGVIIGALLNITQPAPTGSKVHVTARVP
jgi:hypothetical protein